MPTRRKKKLQNGQFSYVMWQMDMGEEHKRERERPGQKLGTKAQSSKQRAKKGPPKKKEKKGKKKRKKKCTYKVYICSLEKIVLVHNKRNALHSMVWLLIGCMEILFLILAATILFLASTKSISTSAQYVTLDNKVSICTSAQYVTLDNKIGSICTSAQYVTLDNK